MDNQNCDSDHSGKAEDFQRQFAERRYARQRLHKVRAIQDQKSSCSSNICLRLGDSVQEFTPSFEIPHSTDANYVAGLIADFEQLVDLLIKKPLVAAVSDYLQEQARILATENRGEDSHNGSDSTWCAMPDDFPERLPDKPIKKQTDPGQ